MAGDFMNLDLTKLVSNLCEEISFDSDVEIPMELVCSSEIRLLKDTPIFDTFCKNRPLNLDKI